MLNPDCKWHPENMTVKNFYTVSYSVADEEVLHRVRAMYLGIRIVANQLCLSLRNHKDPKGTIEIPVRRIQEVLP